MKTLKAMHKVGRWSNRLLGVALAMTLCCINPGNLGRTTTAGTAAEDHPRLFFDATEIPALQAQAITTHQEIWTPIRNYASSQLGTSPPSSAPPGGDLEFYRNHGNQLIAFAFACIITEETDYCDLAKTYLLTYVSWEQWGDENHRDIGHAHMLLGNAIAYDWLYNALTPVERQTVRASLAGWAHKMNEAGSEPYRYLWDNWWPGAYVQNHNWINHSAMGVAGLVLLGEDDRAQMWIDQASSRMSRVQDALNGIEDGSWHESIPYGSYGLTLSLPFMVNLRRIQGIEILPHAYLRNYPYWRIYNHIPNSTQFILAHGDFDWGWSNGYKPQNLLRFIASEYSDGHAEWMAQRLIAAEDRSADVWSAPWYVLEFLYYDPAVAAQSPTDLEKAREFPDLEGVIWRTGWGQHDLIFALKSGTYGGRFAFNTFTQHLYPWEPPCPDTGCELSIGHDHDDTNGFYIHRAARWLAPEREGYGRRATALHNTLLIDGQGQYRPPDEQDPAGFIGSDGFLEATANTPNFDYVAADATRRYRNVAGLEDVTRYVVFVRPDYFLMLDNLAADEAHQYEWVCHFGESVSVEGNWVRGNAGGGQILGVGVAAPLPFWATTGNDGRPYIRIRPASPANDVRFTHILYPTDDASWNTKPTVDILDDTGEVVAVRVQMNDGSGRTDDVLITYAQSVSGTASVPYHYDGHVAVVARGVDEGLEKLFVYGGTFLTDQAAGRALVTNLDANEPFEATYSDRTVTVYSNTLARVTLYAPQVEDLVLNGLPWPFTRSGDYITFESKAVAVSGPATGLANTPATFTATVSPSTTTQPITYAWQATGLSPVTHPDGDLDDTVPLTWTTPGLKLITVTASSTMGAASETHPITINAVAPWGVSISNPLAGVINTPYVFAATVRPVTATHPITYTWQATDLGTMTHAGGDLGDAATFTWITPGLKIIAATVTNVAGSMASAPHTITIDGSPGDARCYLPTVLRRLSNRAYSAVLVSPVDDVRWVHTPSIPATAVGPYHYDGQIAVVTRGADSGLERLFVYGGTFLTDQAAGKVLVTNLDANEPFEATYSGQTVTVYSNLRTKVTLYAPQVEHLILNGVPWPFTRSGEYITFGYTGRAYLPLILRSP